MGVVPWTCPSETLSQGDFATEARLELHRSGWADSFDKLRELIESGA
jgi:hypothetical protein